MNTNRTRGLTAMPTALVGSLMPNGKHPRGLPSVGLPRRRGPLRRIGRRRSRIGWRHVLKYAPYAGTAFSAASTAAELAHELQTLKRSGNGRSELA